ncbi:MAG: N-acetyltransferase family protein [Terriglobales bacterium]
MIKKFWVMAKNVFMRFRQHGWRTAWTEIKWSLEPTLFQLRQWDPTAVGEIVCPGVEFSTDLDLLRRLRRAANLPIDFFRDQIDGGEFCCFAVIDGQLAAIVWAYDSRRPAHFVRMGERDLEICSAYTLSAFRGRRLFRAMMLCLCQEAVRRGANRIFANVHSRNIASQKGLEGTGFKLVAEWRRSALFGPKYNPELGRLETLTEMLRYSFRKNKRTALARAGVASSGASSTAHP